MLHCPALLGLGCAAFFASPLGAVPSGHGHDWCAGRRLLGREYGLGDCQLLWAMRICACSKLQGATVVPTLLMFCIDCVGMLCVPLICILYIIYIPRARRAPGAQCLTHRDRPCTACLHRRPCRKIWPRARHKSERVNNGSR